MPAPPRKIRLSFPATGESAVAQLLDEEAPKVCQQIWDWLPIEHKAIHGQVSGPEVFVLLSCSITASSLEASDSWTEVASR
jgi:hypothetical protein